MARKPAEDRKAEIIAALLTLSERIGPDRVTTGAVAQAVGVTQAALFRHFPTKAVLWQAAVESLGVAMEGAWAQAQAGHDRPLERVRALAAAQFRQIAATPALLFSLELRVDNPELRSALRNRLTSFLGLLADEVMAAQTDGSLSGLVPGTDAAALLASTVQGVAIRWALGGCDFPLMAEGMRLIDVQLGLMAA